MSGKRKAEVIETHVAGARVRGNTPFDEAKRAQGRLEKLEEQRAAVLSELSEEAATLLKALEDLRLSRSATAEQEA